MKIDQLRQIIEIAKTNSINQAAINLYLSQPNLSTSIRNLEEELGCALISRTSRGVKLTPKGRDFVEYAQSVVKQFDHLKTIGHPERDPNMASLSVANMHFRFVTLAATELLNKYENQSFHLTMKEGHRDSVLEAVANGDAEIGFINILSCYEADIMKQIHGKGLQYTELSKDDVMVIVGRRNPLYSMGDMDTVSPEMLENYPIVNYEEMDFYHYSDKARLVGIRRTSSEITVTSRKAFHEILEHTPAFGVVSFNQKHYQRFDYGADVRFFHVKDCNLFHTFGYVTQKDSALSLLGREFLSLVMQDL